VTTSLLLVSPMVRQAGVERRLLGYAKRGGRLLGVVVFLDHRDGIRADGAPVLPGIDRTRRAARRTELRWKGLPPGGMAGPWV
jgi:hypothetical protein